MKDSHQLPPHFYSLDVLRGLGALTVVLNHWPVLLSRGHTVPHTTDLPFYAVLWPFYRDGWLAVDMFFCLSGFVFFWLYSRSVSDQSITARNFFGLRFSRLYPLHFVTLLIVACGQLALVHLRGSPLLVIQNNDIPHFIRQLFFISGWDKWGSFNFPTWSITVELILYVVFFIVCRFRLIRWWQILIYIAMGEVLCIHHGSILPLARGILGFFVGGLSYQIFLRLHLLKLSNLFYILLIPALTALWILVPLDVLNSENHPNYLQHTLAWKALWRFAEDEYVLLPFPFTIITLALWEGHRGSLGKRIGFIGDLSYSTYLIHFPL